MSNKLTPKQEKFAQKYVELSNASEAYRQSYNTSKMTTKSVNELACRELAKIKVASRVIEIQEEARERNQVTIESLAKELDETRDMALTEKQLSVSYQSTMGKAKLYGLIVDKQKVDTKVNFVNDLLDTIDGNTAGLPKSTD
jgi:phage terminase small subunit